MPALLALAELAGLQGRRDVAERLTKEAIALAPKDPRPWHFKGTLALASGDTRGALEAVSRAIALEERYADPRITRASILIDLGRLDEAELDLAAVALHRPREPRAMYLRAIILGKRGDDSGARDALREVARAIDPVPREILKQRAPEFLVLGGLAHHGLNAREKARRYFEDYLAVRPRDVAARRLLASILIAQGYMQDAISVLEVARKDAPGDPQVLALLALGHMGRKQYQLASGYLEDALRTSGEAPEIRATLGFSVLGSGQSDLGLDHLERAFKKDAGQVHVGTALTVLYLRRGQPKRAVEVAEEVARLQPKNVVALNLLGAARAGTGDRRGARTAYEKAVALDRAFVPAQLNLGRLESADGNPDAARRRFEAILQAHPKNAQAMLELAAVEEAARRPAEATRWLEKLRSLDHRNVQAASRLVDLYISTRAVDKALEVAKETEARQPENLDALAALVRAYLAVGNGKAAQTVLNRMSRLAGFDPAWQTRIARSQLAAGNTAGAVYSLEKALSGRPGYVPAEALLAEVELQSGEVAKAEQRARAIVKRVPDDPAGPRLLADIAMARKRYPEAIENYGRALAKEQTTAAALRLYRAYLNSGSVAAGNEFMESWLKSRPEDVLAQRALAEGYLRAGNPTAARTRYEQVLRQGGEDPLVLNNLAYLMLGEKDARAREYAERAHRLAPTDPSIQGTLGWVLVNQGQLEAGLRHLREARLRDPQEPEIRYHLAAALAQAGRREEARLELDEALKRGVPFNGIADARKLMAELSSR
jgi:putative PEP-CTERM system TPR-repeat lipoprotein